MVYYRKHRGGLFESLETEKMFETVEKMLISLKKQGFKKVLIRYYGFDDRENIGSTFIVIDEISKYPLGFMYLRDIE